MKKKYVKVIGIKMNEKGEFYIVKKSNQKDHKNAGRYAQENYEDDIIYVGIPFCRN